MIAPDDDADASSKMSGTFLVCQVSTHPDVGSILCLFLIEAVSS